MNLLSLPVELLVNILSCLDVTDLFVCRRVCHYCLSIVQSTPLQYRILLARAGLIHGHTTPELSAEDRITALEAYARGWKESRFAEYRDPQASRVPPKFKTLKFSGGVIPIVTGSELRLVCAGSPGRQVPMRIWSFSLKGIHLELQYGVADLSQSIFALFGYRLVVAGKSLECRLLSLDNSVVKVKSEALVPVINIPIVSQLFPSHRTENAAIHYDLLAWTWLDEYHYLRIYNWRTGQAVWHSNIVTRTRCPSLSSERLYWSCQFITGKTSTYFGSTHPHPSTHPTT
ncbi:hypothetical protein C8Q77DRAFT_834050 [Trametes polyzona]|nr:hypothetical protein C8Q77DRAFT_834050 [Trametes polyzona]